MVEFVKNKYVMKGPVVKMKRNGMSVVALAALLGLSACSSDDMPTNEAVDQLLEAETEKRTVRLAEDEPTERSEQLLALSEQNERDEAWRQWTTHIAINRAYANTRHANALRETGASGSVASNATNEATARDDERRTDRNERESEADRTKTAMDAWQQQLLDRLMQQVARPDATIDRLKDDEKAAREKEKEKQQAKQEEEKRERELAREKETLRKQYTDWTLYRDPAERGRTYRHPDVTASLTEQSVYATIGMEEGRPGVHLFLNVQYAPEQWMAIDSMQLRIDDRTYVLKPDYVEREEETDERRARVIGWQVGETERKALRTLRDGDDVTLRLNGLHHYEDRTLSTDEVKVLRQTFELYEQTERWSNASKRPLYE